jgi:hypothetical protein
MTGDGRFLATWSDHPSHTHRPRSVFGGNHASSPKNARAPSLDITESDPDGNAHGHCHYFPGWPVIYYVHGVSWKGKAHVSPRTNRTTHVRCSSFKDICGHSLYSG